MFIRARHTRPARQLAAAIALALGTLLAAGCSSQSEQDLLDSARNYIAKDDRKAAIIQLKTALQLNQQSSELRFMLGQTLLDMGDGVSAVVELEKALGLGYPQDRILPLLGRGLVGTDQAKRLVELHGRTRLTDPKADAELRAWVATAFAQLGQPERAEANMNAALQLNAGNLVARTLLARFTAGRGEVDKALTMIEAVLAEDRKRLDAWQLKADLLSFGKQNKPAAAAAYREALMIEPRFQEAHVALIGQALEVQDIKSFKAQLAEMKKALPRSSETKFYEAQAALIDGQIAKAREIAQGLLQVAPNNYRVLQLSGAIELNGGSLILAETHLIKAVQGAPELVQARRLLAQTYLRLGQPGRAVVTLQQLVEGDRPDAQALAMTAEAYLQEGKFAQSERFFQAAAKLSPDDPKVRAALALSQIAKGQVESGFSQLEALAAVDKNTAVDLVLISARMRRKELPAALKAIDRLELKTPSAALPHHLRGRVLALQGQTSSARASFERALTTDPSYFPAVATLAVMDVADKQVEQAQKRVQAYLVREPTSFQALLALADLKQRSGSSAGEVQALLVEAVKANQTEATPRLLLVNFLLAQKNGNAAKAAAQEAVARLPNDADLQDALGRSHLAVGEVQQAIATFAKVAAAQPNSVLALSRLADAQLQNKDVLAATGTLRRALELDPQSLLVQGSLMQAALRGKRPADALEIARAVQKQRPSAAVGHLMEVDTHANGNQLPQAIAAMTTALRLEPATSSATRLHALLTLAERGTEADRLAASWLKDNPKDASFIFYLGSTAMDAKRPAEAEARYRVVVELRPNDPTALNNLAWTLVEQGKPGARALAQKANELAPNQAPLMDTMAAALATEGQIPQALEWQRKAVERAPESPNYRLRLSELLIQSGNKTAARAELETLTKLGDRYTRQADVAVLLKKAQ